MGEIIEKIIKQLTSENVKKEIEAVQRVELSPELQKWVKKYEKVGDPSRNEYLWKWMFKGAKVFTGNRIDRKYSSSFWEAELLLFILNTTFDDIADKKEFRNRRLLEEILKVPFQQNYIEPNRLNEEEKNVLDFAIRIWNHAERRMKEFPRYEEFKDIFKHDFSQLLNTKKYCYLVHENNYLLNKTENWLYLPHSMHVMTHMTLELMCSPKFDIKELGKLREVAWHLQKMSRIGNWLSTWEREIEEGDFTSGVFVYGLDFNIITIDELAKGNKSEIIKKIKDSKIEEKLLKEWEQNYWEIDKLAKGIKSVDIKQIFLAMEKILFFHLSSRGYK